MPMKALPPQGSASAISPPAPYVIYFVSSAGVSGVACSELVEEGVVCGAASRVSSSEVSMRGFCSGATAAAKSFRLDNFNRDFAPLASLR